MILRGTHRPDLLKNTPLPDLLNTAAMRFAAQRLSKLRENARFSSVTAHEIHCER